MDNNHHHRPSNNLLVAFVLNLTFTILEFAGGWWTNSIAILSDAVHDSGDCLALGLAWWLQRASDRAADRRFTYGYRRLSSLGALITGVILLIGLGFVGTEAVRRLLSPEPVLAPGVVALAIVGVLFNGAAAWRLHGGQSLNERVASWHLLEDTLGWVAVLIGGLAMSIWNVPIIDPILSLAISVFILWNVGRNLRKVALVFLQAAPPGFDPPAIERQLREISGVIDAHHTHTWTLDGEHHVFSTHVVMFRDASRQSIIDAKRRVHEMLQAQSFEHITVDVELEGERCAAGPEGCG